MLVTIITLPLSGNAGKDLFEFMDQDRDRHFYTIYDLKYLREKERVWLAYSEDRIVGYMLEHDRRILHLRGIGDSAVPLLRNSDLATPLFNIEPQHFSAVNRLFEPIEPVDKMTVGKITTFLLLKVNRESFRPAIRHEVRELAKDSYQSLSALIGTTVERAQDLLRGLAFGIFEDQKLVSSAVSPEMLEDLAIVRGVHTAPDHRNKGYSTSVCSVLVKRLIDEGREVVLYVSKDNPAALRVYRRIGFMETGHTFLSFLAKLRNED